MYRYTLSFHFEPTRNLKFRSRTKEFVVELPNEAHVGEFIMLDEVEVNNPKDYNEYENNEEFMIRKIVHRTGVGDTVLVMKDNYLHNIQGGGEEINSELEERFKVYERLAERLEPKKSWDQ